MPSVPEVKEEEDEDGDDFVAPDEDDIDDEETLEEEMRRAQAEGDDEDNEKEVDTPQARPSLKPNATLDRMLPSVVNFRATKWTSGRKLSFLE